MEIDDLRKLALARFLDEDVSEIEQIGDCEFSFYKYEYLVLEEDEADEKVYNVIMDELWTFNPSFLADETGLPEKVFVALQEDCEDSNETIERLINDKTQFVVDAVNSDGRGHFLSQWDSEENEVRIPVDEHDEPVDDEANSDGVYAFYIYRMS